MNKLNGRLLLFQTLKNWSKFHQKIGFYESYIEVQKMLISISLCEIKLFWLGKSRVKNTEYKLCGYCRPQAPSHCASTPPTFHSLAITSYIIPTPIF